MGETLFLIVLVVAIYFIIQFFLARHVLGRAGRKKQLGVPRSVRIAAYVELVCGMILVMATSLVMLVQIKDLGVGGRFALATLIMLGLVWIAAAQGLCAGGSISRWVVLSFAIVRLVVPVIGLILSCISVYLLFFSKESREYFAKADVPNQRLEAEG